MQRLLKYYKLKTIVVIDNKIRFYSWYYRC